MRLLNHLNEIRVKEAMYSDRKSTYTIGLIFLMFVSCNIERQEVSILNNEIGVVYANDEFSEIGKVLKPGEHILEVQNRIRVHNIEKQSMVIDEILVLCDSTELIGIKDINITYSINIAEVDSMDLKFGEQFERMGVLPEVRKSVNIGYSSYCDRSIDDVFLQILSDSIFGILKNKLSNNHFILHSVSIKSAAPK